MPTMVGRPSHAPLGQFIGERIPTGFHHFLVGRREGRAGRSVPPRQERGFAASYHPVGSGSPSRRPRHSERLHPHGDARSRWRCRVREPHDVVEASSARARAVRADRRRARRRPGVRFAEPRRGRRDRRSRPGRIDQVATGLIAASAAASSGWPCGAAGTCARRSPTRHQAWHIGMDSAPVPGPLGSHSRRPW